MSLPTLPIETVFVIYAVLGLVWGIALERGRLCFVSAFRDIFVFRNSLILSAVMVSIGIAATAVGTIQLATGVMPVLLPGGWYTFVGGFFFGMGAAIAGGCASGLLFRSGQGYVPSWVELVGFSGGLLFWAGYLHPFVGYGEPLFLPHVLGISPFIFGLLLGVASLSIGLTMRFRRRSTNPGSRRFTLSLRRAWDPLVAGLVMAAIQIILFVVTPGWYLGVAAPIATYGGWVLASVGVDMTGWAWSEWFLDPYPFLFLVTFTIVGAFIAAVLGRDFRIRVPKKRRRLLQALLGGTLAGAGTGLAYGCNISGFYSGLTTKWDMGVVLFVPALVAGIYAGQKITERL